MRRLLIASTLLLTACATNAHNAQPPIPPAEGLRLSCEAFSSELNILAPLRANGTLSATAVGIVQTQKDATDKLCDAAAPAVDASISKVAVDASIQVLISLAGQFVK